MKIKKIDLVGFRNFLQATINFNDNTLVIGANDVGKSNMLHALRILLDKSLSDSDIEPTELDFHIDLLGNEQNELSITICFSSVFEDSALSVLKGHVSDEGVTYFRYTASRDDLSYRLFVGYSLDTLEEVSSRFYLKYIHLKYIQSRRDLDKFIYREKKQLLKIAQNKLSSQEDDDDRALLQKIGTSLNQLNIDISQLKYVSKATDDVNEELQKLGYQNENYKVQLDTGAIEVTDFIDKLKLGAKRSGSSVLLGGDGRNNQILLALWKAKSMIEYDSDHEVIFYVIEEPEAHLHPHQQRKLSSYLVSELPSQTIISTHSPQIAASFSPNSIIRLLVKQNGTIAASDGCSENIEKGYLNMGYRMSIIPAEAFYSNGVFLVEGPSEELFYHQLAISLGVDLDFYNISILSVDGISFQVFVSILDALEIPWVMRTDNDVSKVPHKDEWRYAGLNRALRIAGEEEYPNNPTQLTSQDLIDKGLWKKTSELIEHQGIYISKIDLENDLVNELGADIRAVLNKSNNMAAVKYLQGKKAIRMAELLRGLQKNMYKFQEGNIAKPLLDIVARAK